ncbi:MAG: hypothetical protein AAGI34_18345, partial [Pseudomonadota bacterium]
MPGADEWFARANRARVTRMRVSLVFLAGLVALAGCTPEPALPDLDTIYADVARAGPDAVRRPLITVPGTLGSVLRDQESGTVVWGGGSRGLSADPDDPEEARLIALPIAEGPVSALRDGVVPSGILDRAQAEVLGLPVEIEVYAGILRTLTAGGFRSGTRSQIDAALTRAREDNAAGGPSVEDYASLTAAEADAFRFDYDWRRDIPALAREFHAFVLSRKRQVAAIRSIAERRSVDPDSITFDLLAHSMGGLVTRYYLMYGPQPLPEDGTLPILTWEGARHFQRVVWVATPNAGSILAMDNLINGKSLGPFQPFYPGALLATHVSVWQMMPRARHERVREANGNALDLYDPALWERHGWGLLDPEAEALRAWLMPDITDPGARLDRARRHQARLIARAKAFHAAMDRPTSPPARLETFLVVGGGFATPAAAEVDPASGSFTLTAREEGDGVVLRASVLLDERQGGTAGGGLRTPLDVDTTLFLPDEHVELAKDWIFG